MPGTPPARLARRPSRADGPCRRCSAGWDALAARRRQLLVAAVTAAAPLSAAQAERLAAVLERTYGREVRLTVAVDPEVIGGLRVQVGAQVVDATVLAGWTTYDADSPAEPARPRAHAARAADRSRSTRRRRKTMAELTIKPEEIRAALDSFVASYAPSGAVREEVGRVTLAGDGIAQVEGLPGAMANELLEFEDGTLGLALNLDVREIGVVVLGEFTGIEEGQVVRRTGEVLSVPVGRRLPRPRGRPAGQADRRPRRGRDRGPPRPRAPGPRRDAAQERPRAAADRPQGDRRDDPDRSRPAPADHRRPPDRQDGDRDRHDHQPAGATGSPATRPSRCAASTSRSARRARPSPRCAGRSRTPARWSTRRSSPRPRRTRRASSTSPRTPARRSASTGCTPASTC